MVRCLQLICAFGVALSLTGCLGQVGFGVLFLASFVVLLGSVACTVPISVRDAGNKADAVSDAGDFLDASQSLDAGTVDAARPDDAGPPEDASVRFDAGDGMDAGPTGPASIEDAGGIADACDGTWQPACSEQGELVQECCPAGVACNYLPYQVCADGSCVLEGADDTCREPRSDGGPTLDSGQSTDGGAMDAGCSGTWQTACTARGELVQECCPAGVACNYLPYQLCEDGSCVLDGLDSTCRESNLDAGASTDAGGSADAGNTDAGCDGTWSSVCSLDGEVVEQCCPAGVACNYLPYQICEDGSCVTLEQECTAR